MSGPGGPGDFDPYRDDLDVCRREIDHLDRQIAEALALRAQIAEKASEARDGADPGRDPEREREIVEKVRDTLEMNGVADRYDVDGIYERIFEATRGIADDEPRYVAVRAPFGEPTTVEIDHDDGRGFVEVAVDHNMHHVVWVRDPGIRTGNEYEAEEDLPAGAPVEFDREAGTARVNRTDREGDDG